MVEHGQGEYVLKGVGEIKVRGGVRVGEDCAVVRARESEQILEDGIVLDGAEVYGGVEFEADVLCDEAKASRVKVDV